MTVNNIELKNFRNYSDCFVNFSDGVNVIVGDNAQGKTNLLEAVFYLTGGKSFRTRFDKELICFNDETALIKSDIFSDGRNQKIEVRLSTNGRKQIFANGVRLKTASELSGKLTAVLFCPDDLYIIKEGASARRRLMNICISQLRPRYVTLLSEYNRILENKTRILRDWREKPSLLDTLDDFSYELSKYSAEIIYYRAHFIKKLSKFASEIHNEFSGGKEKLDVYYKTVKTVDDPLAKSPSEIFGQVLDHAMSHRKAEIESGLCLSGAHKDDLEILINGNAAKTFASQGQTRTAALSLKLAEREIHFEDKNEYPVLLLDDVLSELDPLRQDFILNKIKGGQIFITCCEDRQITEKTGGRILHVEKGEII